MSNLLQYKSHKLVRASKVLEVRCADGFGLRMLLESGDIVDFTQDKTAPNPVGGYYIQYEDGYTSWSPAEAFEKGHTLVPAG